MNKQIGFTIVELLIVVAIVGILAIVAMPSMREYVSNSAANSLSNTLLIDIMYARNYAITKEKIVKMVPTGIANSGESTFTPNSAGVNWGQGWTVFQDDNDNNIIDSGENIIRYHSNFGPGAHISSGPAGQLLDSGSPIGFNPTGLAYGKGTNTGRGTLYIATFGCVGPNAHTIQINQIGQIIGNEIQCPSAFYGL